MGVLCLTVGSLPGLGWPVQRLVITWTSGATSQSVGVRGKHVLSAPVSLGDEPKGLRVYKGNTRPSAVPGMNYAMRAQAGFLVTPTVGPSVMGVVWLDRKPSWCAPGIGPGFSEQHGTDLIILVESWVLSLPVPWSPPCFLHPAVPEWLWASVSSSLK